MLSLITSYYSFVFIVFSVTVVSLSMLLLGFILWWNVWRAYCDLWFMVGCWRYVWRANCNLGFMMSSWWYVGGTHRNLGMMMACWGHKRRAHCHFLSLVIVLAHSISFIHKLHISRFKRTLPC